MPWYMVHKHDATRAGLHWDLRLEQNGVLKSWAIPKGMPRKSGVRHLAIQTPDHDMDYGKWEGTIPEGSYGAGKVTIDAAGEYQTIEQTKKKWKFECLTGKYTGMWTLIHWKNKQWLITKSTEQKSAEAPLKGQTFAAPYEIKIYVPSTRLDTKISEAAFQNRIGVTKSFLSHLFGGYTSVQAQGGYLSNDGGVITEPVVVVTGFANPKDYESKLPLLEAFIKSKQKRWGQESLGFEFENDFFMYPDF